ncbi:zinc knuckle CX2CX4HX4C containing protein [Tanacetum coccineum]
MSKIIKESDVPITMKGQDDKSSFVSMLKKTSNVRAAHIQKVTNDIVIPGANVAIPIEAVEEVLENGPWLIRLVPIVLNIWTANTRLKRKDIMVAPVWVKLYKVPIVAYSEVGLSLILSQIGCPIMLGAYTSSMCLKSWGRNAYARAHVEVSADKELVDSLVVAIPYKNENGHSLETIEIEYEWRPPRCDMCKLFDHKDNNCPKLIKTTTTKPVDDDGFVQHYTQPTASTSKLNKNGSQVNTKQQEDNVVSKQPINEVKSPIKEDDGINIVTLKNSFTSLMEEDKVLDSAQPGDSNEKIDLDDDDDDVEEVFVENQGDTSGSYTTITNKGASTPSTVVPDV